MIRWCHWGYSALPAAEAWNTLTRELHILAVLTVYTVIICLLVILLFHVIEKNYMYSSIKPGYDVYHTSITFMLAVHYFIFDWFLVNRMTPPSLTNFDKKNPKSWVENSGTYPIRCSHCFLSKDSRMYCVWIQQPAASQVDSSIHAL